MSYENWLARVAAMVQRLAGVSVHDLTDAPYLDMYDDGMNPPAAARRAIRLDQGGGE